MMRRFAFACAIAASLAHGAALAGPDLAAGAPAAGAPVPSPSASATPAATAAASVLPPTLAPAPSPRPPAAPLAMTAGPAAGSLIQTIFALSLVLALLAGLAWFMKRFGPKAQAGSAHLRLVGALNLGGRERIMVVEVGDQWIVVGASPGRINALATMPRQPGEPAGAMLHPHQPPASSFSEWLKQTIDKRNAK
jgi:flagellar protein FliO/FliZ